ncbi:hypothetical protein CCYA_CCYA05G1609 [Cyanidiococcus yangmingshanensis]|nr:hypothetical protein CCYA_CCYA05G1609 [Cyanidiococcus yangmingshanensis]
MKGKVESIPRFRTLHWVFKDPNRRKTYEFYRKVLGMQVLRHEEFEGECKAACNGPYDNRWSKSMYGYGPENTHFACELTYNYPIKHYRLGNDLRFLELESSAVQDRVRASGWPLEEDDGGATLILQAPGGYIFRVCCGATVDETKQQPSKRVRTEDDTCQGAEKSAVALASVAEETDFFRKVSLHVTDLERSIRFYRDELGMELVEKGANPEAYVRFRYPADRFLLELVALPAGMLLDHAEAHGRIAFSISTSPIEMEKKITQNPESLGRVQTPLVALETPGKATVEVVILQDPDSYEICFVGEGAFYELCARDPKAEAALQKAIEEDRSDEVPAWRAASTTDTSPATKIQTVNHNNNTDDDDDDAKPDEASGSEEPSAEESKSVSSSETSA